MLFKNSPSKGQRATTVDKRRLGVQFFFLLVVAAAMFTFLWKKRADHVVDSTWGGPAEDIFGGGPFDNPGPWMGKEDDAMLADFDKDDPFKDEGPIEGPIEGPAKVPLEPWNEDAFVMTSAASRDRTPDVEEKGVILESAVGYLAHQVAWQRRDGAETSDEEPVLSTMKGHRVWDELYKNPDKYRGKLVELQASVVRAARGEQPVKLRALPNEVPAGTDRAYRAYVVDGQRVFNHYLVYTLDDQRKDIQHLDGVLLRGYFCRLYRGEISHNGKANERSIPVLVGARYEKMEMATSGSSTFGMYFAIAVGLLSIAGLTIFFVSRVSESNYDERRKAGRKNFAGAGASSGEAGKPKAPNSGGGVVED